MGSTVNGMKQGKTKSRVLIVTVAVLALPFARIGHGQSTVEQAVVEKARSLESRGLTDLAAQTWQQVLLSQPDNTEALAGLARMAKKQGKNAEAARYLDRLRQINPKDPQIAVIESTVTNKVQSARQAQAESLAAAGNYSGAMEIFRQIFGEHPPDDVALEYYDTEAATEAGRVHAITGLRDLVKRHPSEGRYQATLGRVLTYNPKTRAEGETILQQLPQDVAAQGALRQALLWDAQNPEAAGAIKRYLKVHSDDELAQHLQETETRQLQEPHALAADPAEQAAYAALQANQVDRAEQGFQALLDKEPANPRALAGMGFVHMKQGDFDQAVSDFEAARQHGLKDPKIESALDTARFWQTMGEATKALDQDQLDLAAQRYREALAQRATSPEALAGLAGTLLRGHQTSEAALVYARWVKAQPNSAPAWRGLFMAQAQGGQPTQALASSKRFPSAVQATLQADPEYLMNLATAYRATGDDAKASQTLEHALNLPFPDDGKNMTANLRLQYAAVLAATGRHEQAAALYRQVIVEQPDNSGAWQGLILAQHLLHDDAGAVKTVEQMPRPAYDAARRDAGFLSLIAAAYQQQGRLEEAERLLAEAEGVLAQQGSKTSVDMELQIAAIELQRNHFQGAGALYRRVLDTDPLRTDAWRGLLSTLHQSGDDSRALAELASMPAQVQGELSGNDDYLLTLGAIYSATGNSRLALATLSRLRARYSAQHTPTPAAVEIQVSWLLLRSGDESNLYSALMGLGGRNDLTDAQRSQVQTVWAAWSVRRAGQASDSRRALVILNTAKEALAGNDEVSRSLAGGYLAAGDAPSAMAIFQSVHLSSTADYQGAIGAALATKNLKLAESWLRQALEFYPQDAKILGLAARFEQARGDNGKARDYWKASLAMSPDSGAADRLAHTLRTPAVVLKERGALPSADTLAALLGPASGETRRAIVLPGESGMVSETIPPAAPVPGTNLPPTGGHTTARGRQRLGDYQPQPESPQSHLDTFPLPGAAALRADDAQAASGAPVLTPAYVDPPRGGTEQYPAMGYAGAASGGAGSVSQVDPGDTPEPPTANGRLEAAAEALAWAGNQAGSKPGTIEGSSTGPGDRLKSSSPKQTQVIGDAREPGGVEGPASQVDFAAAPPSVHERLQAAAEALAWAGNQAGSTPQIIPRLSTAPGDRLTMHYASAIQANPPPSASPDGSRLTPDTGAQELPQTPASQQEVPQSPGLTDQQLIDSHLPALSRTYVPAQPSHQLSARQEAQQQIASIDGGFSPWVGGTGVVRHRSGTPGFDQLTALEAPFEASTTLGTTARLTAITTPVFLDAGVATGTSTLNFGTLPVGTIQPQQYADGVASELQLTAINFAARVGATPFQFLVTNITGGVRWRPAGGPLTFSFSRDGVKDTQLSYSGLRDPGSATATFDGNIWGGVIANAGDVQVAHGDALSGFYAGVGGQYITGQHVLDNTRFHGNAGAYWRVLTLPDLGTLVLGANFFGMHYAHNLRYFTYGQGGYFSPEAYFLAAMPLSWTGHYGTDLHYTVTASVGAQSFQENSEPYFPLDAQLQAAFHDPLVPVTASVGINYDLQSEMAYRIQDRWYVGGFLAFNNTRDYLSQSVGFFVRYLFRPQPDSETGPIGAFPREGFRPVVIP